EDTRVTHLPMTEAESETNARAAALAAIRSNPGGWLWQRVLNGLWLWLNLQWDPRVIQGQSIVVLAGVGVPSVSLARLATGLAGAAMLWRGADRSRGRRFVLMCGLFVLAAMSTVVTFVGKRYRVAMIDPYLALLAGGGLAAWAAGSRAVR